MHQRRGDAQGRPRALVSSDCRSELRSSRDTATGWATFVVQVVGGSSPLAHTSVKSAD